MFPQASATYLQIVCSDHSPLLNTLVDQVWKNTHGSSMIIAGLGVKASPTQSYNRGKHKDLANLVYSAKLPTAERTSPFGKEEQNQTLPSKFKNLTEMSNFREALNEECYNEEIFWRQKKAASLGSDRGTETQSSSTLSPKTT